MPPAACGRICNFKSVGTLDEQREIMIRPSRRPTQMKEDAILRRSERRREVQIVALLSALPNLRRRQCRQQGRQMMRQRIAIIVESSPITMMVEEKPLARLLVICTANGITVVAVPDTDRQIATPTRSASAWPSAMIPAAT